MSLFNGIKWPYATMQQLNLDWILTEIKRILGFFPEEGNTGTVLMKTDDGAAWEELPAIDININGVPEDTELTDTDKLIFYDISSSANRKITAPNLLNSMMSNGTPLMDGTASAGTSKKPARYDHRHPTDTSRQAALSGVQMAAVNSGAPANSFDSNGVLKFANGGLNDSDAGYCKMPDGTLICYGNVMMPADGTAAIPFAQQFINDSYSFSVSYETIGGSISGTIGPVKAYNILTSGITVTIAGEMPSAFIDRLRVSYIAVGRWK